MTSCANANLAGALDVSGDLSGRAAELLPGAQSYSTLVALVDSLKIFLPTLPPSGHPLSFLFLSFYFIFLVMFDLCFYPTPLPPFYG